jgi:hypothetical protein
LKITIIWHNELFNGKGLKAKHIIFVGLFHYNAGKNVIYNWSTGLSEVINRDGQAMQWPNERGQNDKRSPKISIIR